MSQPLFKDRDDFRKELRRGIRSYEAAKAKEEAAKAPPPTPGPTLEEIKAAIVADLKGAVPVVEEKPLWKRILGL